MANSWLRLWHDMPNDPKWRTIARVSKQPISLVQSVYIHLLVSASQNVTRGHADVTTEDLASHFDVTEDEIESVISAMQGRVLEGDRISGWERRQPKREDHGNPETSAKSAAERKAAQRDREREKANQKKAVTTRHEESRNVTPDKDKETDKEYITDPPVVPRGKKVFDYPPQLNAQAWDEWKLYRRDMKIKAYAPTSRSEGAAINKLLELSGGNQQQQMSIIQQSMANGWAGLFEIKGGQHETSRRTGSGSDYKGRAAEAVREATDRLSKELGLEESDFLLEENDGDVYGQMDKQERGGPVITLDSSDWQTHQ